MWNIVKIFCKIKVRLTKYILIVGFSGILDAG